MARYPCSKITYTTFFQAYRALRKRYRRQHSLDKATCGEHAYRCPHCHCIHVGHTQ